MKQTLSPSTTETIFRVVAIVEALTWIALLIAMVVKYGFEKEEAVAIPGMVHGIAFMVFLVVAALTAYTFKWNRWVTIAALASSIPPCGTVAFDVWARRKGHFDKPAVGAAPAGAPA